MKSSFGLRRQSAAATTLSRGAGASENQPPSRVRKRGRVRLAPAVQNGFHALERFLHWRRWAFVGLVLCLATTVGRAATNDLSGALQKGLFEEEANHNLDAAITAYQSVAAQFDRDRKMAATAIFRLGEVYRKQGKTNEAAAQCERILREFSDQTELVKLSRGFAAPAKTSEVTSDNFQHLNALLVQAEFDYNQNKLLLDQVSKLSRAELEQSLPTLFPSDSLLTKLLEQLLTSQQQLAALRTEYTPEHADFKKQQATVETIQKQLNEKIAGILAGLKTKTEISRNRVNELQSQLAKTRGDSSSLRSAQTEIAPKISAEDQEIQRIKTMIKDSPDLINAQTTGLTEDVGTPLHKAAEEGRIDVAKFLLDNGADVERKSNRGYPPLYLAAKNGRNAMVELLLSKGANIQAGSSDGYSPLHIAASRGYRTIAETLLKNHADVRAKNRDGDTPLHLATKEGHQGVVELLVANGANVDGKNNKDQTPLFSANSSKNLEMAKFLIANKADVNAKAMEGETPLSSAISSKDPEMARFLIANKADVNAIGKNGMTPLHFAVFGNQLKLVELLLQNGANTEAKYNDDNNYKGWTPLFFAVQLSYAEIVEALLKSGANPNSTNGSGETPLYFAVARGLQKIPELLLANKADPNIQTKTGDTPLGIAKKSYSPAREENVALLLKYGANVNAERLTRISVGRSLKSSVPVYFKGNVPENRFSLFEVTAAGQIPFPDLTRVKIHRLNAGTQKTNTVSVNVEEALQAGDCSKNLWLEWGDIVEIPELDHPLNQQWQGYGKEDAEKLRKCLDRTVSVTIKGQTTNVVLRAGTQELNSVRKVFPYRWLSDVIAPFLRASSDTTRIKISRIDPVTKKPIEIIQNLETAGNDNMVLLLDGDQIEIPERDANAPARAQVEIFQRGVQVQPALPPP